jgi:hypothetical protein
LFRCATRQPVKQKQRQEGKMGRSSACDITALAINTRRSVHLADENN